MRAQASRGAGELTNFQRASVTLDASVKIYGSRVDSVHTIAFQTLSGLSRSSAAAQEGGGGHECLPWFGRVQLCTVQDCDPK